MIALRRALAEDRFRVRRWLSDPALPAWWGPRGSVEAEITLALESESAIARIIEQDGAPVGWGHAVDAALWRSELPPDIAAGTWDMDLFVSRPERRGPDTAAAIGLLAAEVFATTLAVACCSLVPIRNEAAARAYEKAGFAWTAIWHDRYDGPSWIMQRSRMR